MPYRRKYGRRRRFKRKTKATGGSGWLGTAGKALSIGSKALAMAYSLRGLINVEKKQIDTTVLSAAAFTTTPQVIPLTLCAQGDTDGTRNGNKILLKSVSIKFQCNSVDQTATPAANVRILLINDKVSNGVVPAIADILDGTTVLSNYNPDNMGSRFVIMHDMRFRMGVLDTTNKIFTEPTNKTGSFYKKIHWHAKYDGTGATQAEAVSGHLYLVFFASNNTSPVGTILSRVEYIDN